jgi:maltose O-acetyltransferase
MFNGLIAKVRGYRYRRYLADLVEHGLTVGENTTIMDRVFLDPSHCFLISIGENCTVAPNVRFMAHDASMYRHLGMTRLGKITIHANCFIGDSTLILPGVEIGPSAVVGAGSVVTATIPRESVAAGNPARVIGSLKDFLARHEEQGKGRVFRYQEYDISVITEEKKREMIESLQKHPGYMKTE